MDILVNVTNQKLKVATNQKTFVAGTQEFIRFVFELSEDWLQLSTFVQFQQNNKSYNVYLDEENAAYLPPEIQSGEMTIALQGNLRRTIAKSSSLTFGVSVDPIKSDTNGTEITLSLYDQLAGSIAGIEADVDALEERMGTLEKNEVVLNEIHTTVESIMEDYLDNGEFASMIISDGTISKEKIDADFEKYLQDLEDGGADGLYVNPEDNLLYLTQDGALIGEGIELPATGIGFDSAEMDEEGYLHIQLEGEDVIDPVYIGTGGAAITIPGDVNGDGAVDEQDLALLRQYVNRLDVEIDLAAADVDGDGEVKMADVIRLQQYLSGGDVELLSSPLVDRAIASALPIKEGKEAILPEVYYDFGEVASLSVTLTELSDGKAHEYCFEFVPAEGFTGLTVTPEPRWATDAAPAIGKVCQVSILRGVGVMVSA